MSGFIALHLGAGYHAESKRKAYKSICNKACKASIESLNASASAVSVVSECVALLEDCPLTNAGIGSNLTIDGTVECDASIMDGKTLNFGSVGSVYGIKNPIKVAQSVLNEQNKGLLSIGRIPPCTLVGKGAMQWAIEHNFSSVNPNVLVTDASQRHFSRCRSLLDEQKANSSAVVKRNCKSYEKELLDTVGALCIDMSGNVASAVSSGGLMLKHSGRLGQASMYGTGCWAQNGSSLSEASIAISASGAGEYLIKTLFAKTCYDCLSHNSDSFTTLPDILKQKFIESPYLKTVSSKLAGILSLLYYPSENVSELSWAHNTKTFLIGYMSVFDSKPHSFVSEQPHNLISESNVIAGGRKINHFS